MNPGIHRLLPLDDYRSIPAWSPSLVLAGQISMLQLDYDRRHPRDVTPQMKFGAAVHCSVLEPDNFPLRYCIWDGGRRAGKEYAAFAEANDGREILTRQEYDACLAARDAVRAHPVASALLASAGDEDREVSLVWTDRESKLACKGRPDLLTDTDDVIMDLKTTRVRVADDRALTRISSTLGYHIQLAAYQAGVAELTGAVPDCKIIFVEQLPPHDVRAKIIPSAALAQGWDVWQRLLGQIAECERTGVWPGCDAEESDLVIWQDGGEYIKITIDGEAI